MSNPQLITVIALTLVLVAAIAAWFFFRNRRTGRLRDRFGGAEYALALQAGGTQRHGEAELDRRTARVEAFHLPPLAAADRTRFAASWRKIQGRFLDAPAGAVAEADQLVGDVMSTRGYPIGEFEQRAADISVDHPMVLANYRAAHEIAVSQSRGEASTEDLRRAMIHYRSLFEELVAEPQPPLLKVAS